MGELKIGASFPVVVRCCVAGMRVPYRKLTSGGLASGRMRRLPLL